METGNLPTWNGAAGAYARATRILAGMAADGHVTRGFGKCYVSQDMRDFITALNSGDEEQIKFNNLNWLRYDDVVYCQRIADEKHLGQA